MRRARGRDVDGILLFDKPIGTSSNDALQIVKRLFGARKAGHTGSLDLLASGLLPICFGEGTKISGFLLNADKRYRAVFTLGVTTTTGDAEGDVVERMPAGPYSLDRIQRVLGELTGPIEQIPPMHSAVKYQGQRLYKLAHQGIEVARRPRTVVIHKLELIDYRDARLEVYVRCSKGTYVRTLAEDVGAKLGCGGYVSALRRVGVGPFDVKDASDLEAIQHAAGSGFEQLDARLLAIDRALADEPQVALSRDSCYYLCTGQPVIVPHAPTNGLVRLYDNHRRFLGVGHVLDDGRIAPRRLLKVSA